MARPYLARRSISSLTALFSVLACLAAAMPARAAAHLAALKPARCTQPGRFTLFESGQVRPLALSPSGKLLFAANTPDDRLEVFRVGSHGLEPLASIPVGLEPVAVAARSDDEIWVVNHLSDSVSVVKLTQGGTAAASCAPCWWAMSRAISSSPAPGRIAPSSPPPTAARTSRTIRSSPLPAWAARTSGFSTRTISAPRSPARRSPSSRCSPTLRAPWR